ncbi:hypothetical protein [Alteromonas sp. ASW11-130]|uniref:hypothetical protein n=1 Tax=Alteromonas sp. ASW11-130 TaxID=3015775 RepID=UPI0022425064|nr:hypothetical protein [Alteromonas sp. ASW11-130]MCW8091920.1 hypothetical protein [Alteromonas sp. ASW11-130]
MKNLNQYPETLSSTEAQKVAGGATLTVPKLSHQTLPIEPIAPPRYFTLAIGEGGGHLPDLY